MTKVGTGSGLIPHIFMSKFKQVFALGLNCSNLLHVQSENEILVPYIRPGPPSTMYILLRGPYTQCKCTFILYAEINKPVTWQSN